MKVFTLAPREDWIVDRLTAEFIAGNPDIATLDPHEADVVWLFADWAWNQLPYVLLKNKRVITTVHHIVPEKFGDREERDFKARDFITSAYHVPNEQTRRFVSLLTTKPIHVIPYWVNQNVWVRQPKDKAREDLGLSKDSFLIGSFQRDTEGKDLTSPKLEKGPDLFCDAVIELAKSKPVEVILSGWRRQYVMRRLDEAHVRHRLFEKVSLPVMAQLYSALDLYIVSSRYEGGPQALLECAVMGVPIVSTPVGMANVLLAPESIGNDVSKLEPNTTQALMNVTPMTLPQGFVRYRELFHAGA